jgi:hypothetical protein
MNSRVAEAVSSGNMRCLTLPRGLPPNIVFLSKRGHENIVFLSKDYCVPG